jgi:GT2 family glycosyltransferase
MADGLSVVLATRNRPALASQALRALLADSESLREVVVVDQSDDGETAAALQPLIRDTRVRYARSDPRGLARARNEGLGRTRGELIAFTDDDCEVPPGFAAAMLQAFDPDGRIAVVFGDVVAAEHDPAAGFIPSYRREAPLVAGAGYGRSVGIGACMGVRRAVWQTLGGFDEELGAGAPFQAADDGDFAIRALAAGFLVHETPSVWVVHHGLRSRSEALDLARGYAFGTGAMMAKHVRCGTPFAWRVLGGMAWNWLRGGVHPAARVDARAHRSLRLGAFARGLAAGARAPIDPAARRFVASNAGRVRGDALP